MTGEREAKTLLLVGSGGGGANNLMRAIRHGPRRPYRIIGTNAERFALARSEADKSYLVPHATEDGAYVRALNEVITREAVNLVIPTNDVEVLAISRRRDELSAPALLPSRNAVETCHDKARFANALCSLGSVTPRGIVVEDITSLPDTFAMLGNPGRLWLRMRRGSGSRGSLPVSSPGQAGSWIEYWCAERGASVDDFILHDFLPGRDFAHESLWDRGRLVISKTCERLEYLFGANIPSGTMSTPRVGKLVRERSVDLLCERVVKALDERASGIFSIDVKEDAAGNPMVTEVNIGRFFRISPIFNLSGRHNLAHLFLDVAFSVPTAVPEEDRRGDFDEDTYWVCDIDGAPSVITQSELEARFETLSSPKPR